MKKTLYISDLDGTLLNSRAEVSEKSKAIISRLITEKNILFSVATARTPATVVRMLDDAIHDWVAEMHVGGSHVDFCAQHHCAFFKFSGIHALEQIEVFLYRTIAKRTFDTGLGRSSFLFGNLFGIAFEPADIPVWHPDVKAFKIVNKDDGVLVAYFYMDLYPREGKYKHAACFDLVSVDLKEDGTYQPPFVAIVANMNKPSKDTPCTL